MQLKTTGGAEAAFPGSGRGFNLFKYMSKNVFSNNITKHTLCIGLKAT